MPMHQVQEMGIALGVSLVIGVICRVFNLPIPAPPTFVGVLMIGGVALGYALGGFWR